MFTCSGIDAKDNTFGAQTNDGCWQCDCGQRAASHSGADHFHNIHAFPRMQAAVWLGLPAALHPPARSLMQISCCTNWPASNDVCTCTEAGT